MQVSATPATGGVGQENSQGNGDDKDTRVVGATDGNDAGGGGARRPGDEDTRSGRDSEGAGGLAASGDFAAAASVADATQGSDAPAITGSICRDEAPNAWSAPFLGNRERLKANKTARDTSLKRVFRSGASTNSSNHSTPMLND